jgi:hypothetical protein
MRLKVEDILKPGAKLETGIVDCTDPEIKKLFMQTKREQEKILRLKNAPFKNLIITI